jgi:aspartate racemase
MKTIGLIGGMSWESSLEYYRIINEAVKKELGKSHSAKCIMYSFDFQEIEELQLSGEWSKLNEEMLKATYNLKNAGADFIVICTNTMHKMADLIENNSGLPLIHIADATAENIRKEGLKKVALLGTKFTMEEDFYKKKIRDKYDIELIIPESSEREVIHKVIYEELVRGIIKESSRKEYKNIIKSLSSRGAEGIILACTEIPLLIKQRDIEIPVFDTTKIHSIAAVKYALK